MSKVDFLKIAAVNVIKAARGPDKTEDGGGNLTADDLAMAMFTVQKDLV